MIRYTLLTAFAAFICVYAWRDWFKALCLLILITTIVQRPDMPSTLLGVTGLSPWNICLAFILMAWLATKKREARVWDMPPKLNWLLLTYAVVLMISAARMIADPGGIIEETTAAGIKPPTRGSLFVDYFINTFKWALPGLLFYDGIRDPERRSLGILAILAAGLLFAIQVVNQMGVSNLGDATHMQQRAIRVLGRNVGYHRVDLSAILAGASWAFFAARLLTQNAVLRIAGLGGAALCALGMALTAGRAGYLAWAAIGCVYAALRWRFLFALAPIGIIAIFALVPNVKERLLEGFTEDTHETSQQVQHLDVVDDQGRDLYAVTSGRVIVWPEVIKEIRNSPLFGYGAQAMQRERITQRIRDTYGPGFGFNHPHNAYLQILLDTGLVGSLPIFFLYGLWLLAGIKLLRSESPQEAAVGAIGVAFVMAQLVASLGAQSFYPREGVVLMWCAAGLLMRVYYRPELSPTRAEPRVLRPARL